MLTADPGAVGHLLPPEPPVEVIGAMPKPSKSRKREKPGARDTSLLPVSEIAGLARANREEKCCVRVGVSGR